MVNKESKDTVKNTGRLCSVYCPTCNKVTGKISFNLLREAGRVTVLCPACFGTAILEYSGKTAAVSWISAQTDEHLRDIAKAAKGN